MPTVMLTTHCPNACPWCFARPKMEEYRARGIREMSWDDFLTVVDFYERSGIRHMILLGGEPAWHSRFMDILRCLRQRRFSVFVATTGILPDGLASRIAEEYLPGVEFGVNSTSYFQYGDPERQRVDDFLHRMGGVTSIGYTITERDVAAGRIEPILDRVAMILKFGLVRHLQFQIAVPGERNRLFVPFDRHGDAAKLIVSWFRILRRNGISCGLDCHCMPACQIPVEAHGETLFHSRCDTFMVDIGPDLEIWPCFPLSAEKAELTRFRDMGEVSRHFSAAIPPSRIVYDERCDGCAERASGACHGGCRGFQHLRQNAGTTRRPAIPGFASSFRRTMPCV